MDDNRQKLEEQSIAWLEETLKAQEEFGRKKNQPPPEEVQKLWEATGQGSIADSREP